MTIEKIILIGFFQKMLIDGVKLVVNSDGENRLSTRVMYIVSVVFGVILSFVFGFDALASVGIELAVPYIGYVLTGFMIGGGSNLVNDFMALVRNGAVTLRQK